MLPTLELQRTAEMSVPRQKTKVHNNILTVSHLPASTESSDNQALIEFDCEKKTNKMK